MRPVGQVCAGVVLWVVVVGCSSPSNAPSSAKTPATEQGAAGEYGGATAVREDEGEIVEGTITAIELHNINKALGHYTFNVELVVDRPGAELIRVRVDKIYWDRLSGARQGEIAPDGPAQMLTPARYEGWAVGDTVSLAVEITSPGLAHLRR